MQYSCPSLSFFFSVAMKTPALLFATALSASAAQGACPSDLEMAALAARYVAREALPLPAAGLSPDDAACGRDKLLGFLGQAYGPPAGYKAALTNPAVQRRFGAASPVRGVLFAAMFLPDGAEVPAAYGARPMVEADLVVEVADPALAQARTPGEARRHLGRLFPFIELADLLVDNPGRLTAAGIVLVNAGARLGVLGAPLPLPSDEALAAMTVRLFDGSGREIEAAPGTAILGHPLAAALWLARDLAAAGVALRKGDLLSLGAYSRLQSPVPGGGFAVVYDGLPGNPRVSVRFR